MAKALFGHMVSGPETHLVAEVRRLRARIAELEAEIVRLRGENEHLLAEIATDTTMTELAGSIEHVEGDLTVPRGRDSLSRV